MGDHVAGKGNASFLWIMYEAKLKLRVNLVNDQLDAQFFYFIIRLLESSTCFEQCRAHHQEVKLH